MASGGVTPAEHPPARDHGYALARGQRFLLGLIHAHYASPQMKPERVEVYIAPPKPSKLRSAQGCRGGDNDHHTDREGHDMAQNGTHFLQRQDIWITTPAGSMAHTGDRIQPRVELHRIRWSLREGANLFPVAGMPVLVKAD
jgi:hypothetical protein